MGDDLKSAEAGYSGSEDPSRTIKVGRPFAPKNIFSLFIGFLWLGPTIALFVLNFKGYIVGAGIGCHGLDCRIDPYSTNQVQQAQALDKKNHDILGALQLVAKALEIWFMFIAGNLVYNVALRLAKKNLLPLSLLTTYAEFLDVLYLKSLITILINIARERRTGTGGITDVPAPSSIMMPNRPANIAAVTNTATMEGEEAEPNTIPKHTKQQHLMLYCFIALVAFLSLVANLMGTSTAILVLPTMNWIDINHNDNIAFIGLKSSDPPRDEVISPGCLVGKLTQGAYACSSSMYAATLDGFMDTAMASVKQNIGRKANAIPPLLQEGNVTATLNISETSRTIWVPNRQTLRDFSTDLNNYYFTTTFNTTNDPRYPDSMRFNQALQTRLQRIGPIIGMENDCVRDSLIVFPINDRKQVLCFPQAADNKCIRWGSGWSNTTQAFAKFDIENLYGADSSSEEKPPLTVSIWETDRATYLSTDDINKCRNSECNWDALLSAPPVPENIKISGSSLTFEYSFPDNEADFQILCNTASYLSFANYVLNPSPLSNILSLIELNVLDDSLSAPPKNDISPILNIHPDWLLLAWSVNKTDGIVLGQRSSSVQLLNAAQLWLMNQDDSPNENPGNRRYAKNFNSLHQYSIVQALSMITYDTSILDTPTAYDTYKQDLISRRQTTQILSSYASIQLWKYGLDSRTSKLGVTVMMIGCLCVIARLIIYYDESKSPTEIVITALEHPTPGMTVNRATGAPLRVSYVKHSRTLSFGTPGSMGASPVQSPPVSP